MQVRVFEAADMASGLKMIKKELGPEALILSTRTIRNGRLGLIGKPILEITAAIDTAFPQKDNTSSVDKAPLQLGATVRTKRRSSGFKHVVDDSGDEPPPLQQTALPSNYGPSGLPLEKRGGAVPIEAPGPDLQKEVNELKDLVKSLAGRITDIAEKKEVLQQQPRQLAVKDRDFGNRYASATIHGDHILSMLIDRGVNVETSRTIAGFLRDSLTDQEQGDQGIVRSALINTIKDLIQAGPPPFDDRESRQRIALVGPTGVGKTTTLAKIAAAYLSRYSHSVALITIDTYRIAAVEQLKVYGEIMGLPVEVVINPEQLEKALASAAKKG